MESAHLETGQALGRLVLDLDVLDTRARWARVEETDDALDGIQRALDNGLDRAVRTIANPAGDSVCLRPLSGGVTKEDSLHTATNRHPAPNPIGAHGKDSCNRLVPSAARAILGCP